MSHIYIDSMVLKKRQFALKNFNQSLKFTEEPDGQLPFLR